MPNFDETFMADQRAALLSLDYATICAYMQKYGGEILPNNEPFWAGVHKARLFAPNLPDAARAASVAWLRVHGYEVGLGWHGADED